MSWIISDRVFALTLLQPLTPAFGTMAESFGGATTSAVI
jgi:hypothetical protein